MGSKDMKERKIRSKKESTSQVSSAQLKKYKNLMERAHRRGTKMALKIESNVVRQG